MCISVCMDACLCGCTCGCKHAWVLPVGRRCGSGFRRGLHSPAQRLTESKRLQSALWPRLSPIVPSKLPGPLGLSLSLTFPASFQVGGDSWPHPGAQRLPGTLEGTQGPRCPPVWRVPQPLSRGPEWGPGVSPGTPWPPDTPAPARRQPPLLGQPFSPPAPPEMAPLSVSVLAGGSGFSGSSRRS